MEFAEWYGALKIEFTKQSDMTLDEASRMVDGCGVECWREMYDDDLSPADACRTEISYWDDETQDSSVTTP